MSNVLDKLPKRLQPKAKAKAMLRDIMYADDRASADEAVEAFEAAFRPKQPKAANCLTKNLDELFTFFDFPAQHWQHLRTSNPIESAFATVRLRQRVTKGAGSRDKALCMASKLLDMAQLRWRKITASEMLPLVRAGVVFQDGLQAEREDTEDAT